MIELPDPFSKKSLHSGCCLSSMTNDPGPSMRCGRFLKIRWWCWDW